MLIEKNGKLIEIECDKSIIVGDLHGDYKTFSKIIKLIRKNIVIIFLGDYADRGEYGVEIIEKIDKLVEKNKNIIALKGNHESYSKDGIPNFSPCDLINEVEIKKGNWNEYFKKFLINFINKLYISAILNNKFLLVHGGISLKIKNRNDLSNPTEKIEEDILWSDPFDGKGEQPNPRGAGVLFGKDVTETICKRLNVEKIIRSHQPYKTINGIFYEHDKKILTINSTSVYGTKPFVTIIEKEFIKEIFI